ncbi:hypothetical protein QBC42DRAFT_18726 [Cladorrhinum samala]|uniref:Heterokaryon incompatibility domain-containing protein n=1 Tax=Cladorrhinum samala TaxID=585594 RepID=A0AAV9HZ41_9PEZI|nr:hypothetical protein QBC42DRAFT_18726 [Cladorrhinum samala]
MRLINVKTKRLELFYQDPTEPYAILSHTWGREDDELSFLDMQPERLDKCSSGRRSKLDRSCAQADKEGIKYVWIDTCCIDKTNAVELSEAINSMFRWYQKSTICYAYLSDVRRGDPEHIGKSRWFTRGWTLQELLAPRRVSFFDAAWKQLGTRSSLSVVIGKATGIPHHILTGIATTRSCSVAQRMSWASRRTTTRQEDMAYCLLGIFDVTISPIYGEGLERAFGRLQEAIMKQTHDDSILAWSLGTPEVQQQNSASTAPYVSGGVMATSPAAFERCGNLVQRSRGFSETHLQKPPEISGGALAIRMSVDDQRTDDLTFGYLSCGPKSDPSLVAAIPLVRCPQSNATDGDGNAVFLRPRDSHTFYILRPKDMPPPKTILIRNDRSSDNMDPPKDKEYWLYLPPNPYPWGARIDEVYPARTFKEEMAMFRTPKAHDYQVLDPSLATVYLVRFTYFPKFGAPERQLKAHFVLVLQFFSGSAVGKTAPRATLYLDGEEPTPFSVILEMWTGLVCSMTCEIINGHLQSILTVSVALEMMHGQPIWVVNLGEEQLGAQSRPDLLPDWPHIPKQIQKLRNCVGLVQAVRGLGQFEESGKSHTRDVQAAVSHLEGTTQRIHELELQIQQMTAVLATLRIQQGEEIRHCSNVRKVLGDCEFKLDAKFRDLHEMDSRVYGRTVWPIGPLDLERKEKTTHEWQLEQDGVIRYLMNQAPIKTTGGVEIDWVPGITLMMYAAATGDPDFVKHILRYDSNFDARDSKGRSPLDWAVASGITAESFGELIEEWTRSQKAEAVRGVDFQYDRPPLQSEDVEGGPGPEPVRQPLVLKKSKEPTVQPVYQEENTAESIRESSPIRLLGQETNPSQSTAQLTAPSNNTHVARRLPINLRSASSQEEIGGGIDGSRRNRNSRMGNIFGSPWKRTR